MIFNPVVTGEKSKNAVFENLTAGKVQTSEDSITITTSQDVEALTGLMIISENYRKTHSFPVYWANERRFCCFQNYNGTPTYLDYSVSGNKITIYRGVGGLTMENAFSSGAISYIPAG